MFWGFTISGFAKWAYYKITRKQEFISFDADRTTAMAIDGANTPTQNDSV
jgi:hypothetical protein